MQRSASRNSNQYPLNPASDSRFASFFNFTHKNGVMDKHKVGLTIACALLTLWVFYDFCCHFHENQYESALADVQRSRRAAAGSDALAVGGVLHSPGAVDGKLSDSLMFKVLDHSATSFVSDSGILAFPHTADHLLAKTIGGTHVATILPDQIRGNHMHVKHSEVLVLIYGRFQLRVSMLSNDGTWIAEDHIFEIGVPSDPFLQMPTTISSTPIGIEILPSVCHALRNIDSDIVSFFASYNVIGMDEKRDEPDRETCRKQPKAFLRP